MKLKKFTQFFDSSKWLIISPFLILFLFGSVFPILWSFDKINSFNEFKDIFLDRGLFLSLKISIVISAISTLIIYLFSYVLANVIYFTKSNFFKSILILSLFLPMVVPPYSFIIIYRSIIEGVAGQSLIYRLFHITTDILTNENVAIISVIFVSSVILIPFTTFLIYTSFKNLKNNFVEMGKLDGLSKGQTLWHILLPITFPVISFYSVYNFLKYLKDFQTPFLMTSGLPPLTNGFFPNSVVGATTNLGVFLYNKLNNVYDVSIIASYSLAVSLIVLIFGSIWYIAKIKKVKRVYIIFIGATFLHILDKNYYPLILYGVACFLFYKHNRRFKTFYLFAVLTDLVLYIILSIKFGVYNDFIISSFVSASMIIYIGFPEINLKTLKIWSAMEVLISSLWLVFSLLPLIALFALSFSYTNFPPFIGPFRFSGLKNFILLFKEEGFLRNILNTFIIAIISSITSVAVTFPVVVASKHMIKLKSFIYSVSMFLGIFTGIHTIIPIYKFFANFNFFNTFVPVIIMSTIHSMPMVFLILIGFLSKYSKSYDEIALIEGASFISRVFKIYLPLSYEAIFLSFTYAFLQAWNSFILPLFLINNDSLYPVSLKLYNYVGNITSTYPKWNLFAAGTSSEYISIFFVCMEMVFHCIQDTVFDKL
jgi:multiple sugar transport system permease protein